MAIKKGNKTSQITFTSYHLRKLKLMEERTGLKKSDIIQRLIEQYDLLGVKDDDLRSELLNSEGQEG